MRPKTTSRLVIERKAPAKQRTYRPPSLLDVQNKDPNFTYRWVRYDDKTIFMGGKDHRGWEIVRAGADSGEKSDTDFTGSLNQFSQSALGSIIRRGGLILARMPKEDADARNEYFAELAARQVAQYDDPRQDVKREDRRHFIEASHERRGLKPLRGTFNPEPSEPLAPMVPVDKE